MPSFDKIEEDHFWGGGNITEQDGTGLATLIRSVYDDISDAESDILTSQGNISTLQSNVSTLQSNMSTAQGDISNIKQGVILTSQIGATLEAALAAASSGDKIVVNSAVTALTAISTASDIEIEVRPNASITLGDQDVDINCSFCAGRYSVFVYGGTGKAYFKKGSTNYVCSDWFGAVGDGVADDTDAISNTILSAINTDRATCVVHIPSGTYLVTSALPKLTNLYGGLIIKGDGSWRDNAAWSTTGIRFSNAGSGINFIEIEGCSGIQIRDITIQHIEQNANTGIKLIDSKLCKFTNLHLLYFHDKGIHLDAVASSCIYNVFDNVSAAGFGPHPTSVGLYMNETGGGISTNSNVFIDVSFTRNGYGIYQNSSCNESLFLGVDASQCFIDGIYAQSRNFIILGGNVESNGGYGINIPVTANGESHVMAFGVHMRNNTSGNTQNLGSGELTFFGGGDGNVFAVINKLTNSGFGIGGVDGPTIGINFAASGSDIAYLQRQGASKISLRTDRVYCHDNLQYIKSILRSRQTVVAAANITPAPQDGEIVQVSLTQDVNFQSPTGAIQGQKVVFILQQDATGGRKITFHSNYKVAYIPEQRPNSITVLEFYFNNSVWIQTNAFVYDGSDNRVPEEMVAQGVYDFSVSGGAQGDFILNYLPDNAFITRGWYDILTPFTAGPGSLVAFGVDTNDPTGLKAATAYNHADYGAGPHDFVPDGTAPNFTQKTTDQRPIVMTVSVADLTAGKVRVWLKYIVSE